MQVYSLRQDRQYIHYVQRATQETTDFGLVADPWLFGSDEWWEAIESGMIPTISLAGTITRVFMSGHNDYPEFEMDDGESRTRWTRSVSGIPESPYTPQQLANLYQEGANVRLDYVVQRLKKPLPLLGPYSKCVLGIWIDGVI